MAILLEEPNADAVSEAIEAADSIAMSAVTLTEMLIVARRRDLGSEAAELLDNLDFEIIEVSEESARRAADAYDQWGKGVHPAGLNVCDCFAYALAIERGCPLLFAGEDFARTDVTPALVP